MVSIRFNGSGSAVHTNGAALVPGPMWVSARCRAQLVLFGASSSLSVPHVTPLEQEVWDSSDKVSHRCHVKSFLAQRSKVMNLCRSAELL